MKKTSLGATELVEWEQVLIISDLMKRLKNDGVSVVAVEQHERSIDYRNFEQTRDSAYLFGNEVDGVSGPLCNEADAVLEIPMVGTKESLNVSVVAGIILYNARKARS
jgi:tRNA G18 (ribose-2'-O)-methylase SpoU